MASQVFSIGELKEGSKVNVLYESIATCDHPDGLWQEGEVKAERYVGIVDNIRETKAGKTIIIVELENGAGYRTFHPARIVKGESHITVMA